MKTEPRSVPSVLLNARPAPKVPSNVPHATHPSTELKVMTHWATELVSARLVTTLWLMAHASNPTVNLTSTAVNAKPTSLSVFNVKPTPTE